MEPLREDWRDVQTAVQRLTSDGKDEEARRLVRGYHSKLCKIRVLDPACGSGNFLYVALEMMKRLEGEVTALLDELGETQSSFITVDPHQFLGIELNPWAANVAELMLWIGYLQWHYRTHGQAAPSEPVLRDFKNIRNGDAVLEWSDRTPRIDEHGAPVTRWDGVTTIRHNVTGEEVPDPDARVQVYDYTKPRATKWPEAEFIVGNPPFIGNKRMRDNLGDGYVEALWKAYPKMPQSADLVMVWWEKTALAARAWNFKTGNGILSTSPEVARPLAITGDERSASSRPSSSSTPLSRRRPIGKAERIAESLTRLDLVILDELGYLPFSASGGALLFHLLSKLYERTSVVLLGECVAIACQAAHHHEPGLQRMGHGLRRSQNDDRAHRPPHPSLPHSGDWNRQLSLQGQFSRRGTEKEGGQSCIDQSLTTET